jgi:hypothetical protein
MAASDSDPKPEPSLQEEREQAIRDMEAGLRRRRLGIRWPTALVAILVAVVLFAWHRVDRDLTYFFSPTQPLTLGSEGGYQWENLRSNRYAQIHGIPTPIGTFSRHGDQVRVTVGLQGTPVLVHRPALPTEDWPKGRPPSAVDQRPFGMRGRLLVEDDARRFQEAFDRLGQLESVQRRDGKLWILLEGDRPRSDAGTLLLSGLLFAFVLLNLWFLLRDLASRRAR